MPTGLRFAPKASAMVDSLFTKGGTDSGFYKVMANGIRFHRPNGEPWFFFVGNRHDEYFPITCSRDSDGRVFYMHGLSSVTEKALGFDAMKSSAVTEFVRAQVNLVRGQITP